MPVVTRTSQDDAIDAVARGVSDDPFAVLGRHPTRVDGRPAVIVRTMRPSAASVDLLPAGREHEPLRMARRHPDGLFEVTVTFDGLDPQAFDYRFRIAQPGG